MTKGIDELINNLRTAMSAERHQVLEQLAHYDPDIVTKSIVAAYIEDDEPERRSLVTPLVKQLQSGSMSQREAAAYALLQIGHFCIPYLDEALLSNPSSNLIWKVKEEIKALDGALVGVPAVRSVNLSQAGLLPSLIDAMIQATKVRVMMGSDADQMAEQKLIAFIEINVDAWKNARSEIVQSGQDAVKFLTEALEDRDIQTRRVAVQLLSTFKDKRITTSLLKALNDEDVFVRDEAASALALSTDTQVMRQLAEAYPYRRGRT